MTHPIFNPVTLLSLLSTVLILFTSYLLTSLSSLPRASPHRSVLLWHTFDALIHLLLELPYVYLSLFTRATPSQILSHPSSKQLLCLPTYPKITGASFSSTPLGLLWQEYAKADTRWGYGEPTTVAVELITSLGAGTLATYISYQLMRLPKNKNGSVIKKVYFWILVLAVAELYGGYMTFVPEWLVGSPHLVTDNWMYLWVYLVFFNMVWVVVPVWMAWRAWKVLAAEGTVVEPESVGGKTIKKRV